MASKRTATSDLNHTNWNQDEDPEDAGSFSKAAEDVIKNRVIKVAKRRNPIGTLATSEGEKKGVFASFGGLSKAPLSTAATSSPFGFLSNIANKPEEQPKTNGLSDTSSIIKTSSATTSTPTFKLPESKTIVSPFVMSHTHNSKKSKDYYAKLKGLNQSVSKWIKKHVDTNPFLNLTPIFRDYEKYLEEIENLPKEDEKESQFTHKVTDMKTVTSTTKIETQKETSTFTFKPTHDNFGNKKSLTTVVTNMNTMSTKLLEAEDDGKDKKSPSFAFGIAASSPTFSFGKPTVQPSTSAAGFSFDSDSTKPFTFSNVTKPAEQEASKNENDEAEDEPPKVEFTPVVEEGHVYTIRCKVFIKKSDKFGDRGVGNMYLKPVPNSDKIQLIVRADTSLGNLLCNFILSKNIPMQRLGKKDVMVVCLPTHDSEPPPVPVLFRVKSPEEADELLKTLEKHKK